MAMATGPRSPSQIPKVPVCGIGASAGGLEALQQFFRTIPVDLGLAYVVIVHLAPDRKSELPAIITRWTMMPVVQVGDHEEFPLEPNHIYVIAPDRKLEITDSAVGASPFEQPRGQRAAIDLFFRSLAATHGDGFAVVLSGSGGDGAVGAKAVKAGGGVVLVQDPDEAVHGDMPRNVMAMGAADAVLPVHLLTARLAELARNKERIAPIVLAAEENEQTVEDEERALTNVLDLVKKRTGNDFSRYKRTTIVRRLARRLQLTQQLTIAEYWQFLRSNPREAQALFDDLLISVTTFFRDPDAWSALQTQVMRGLVERAEAEQLRVWVPGCATGEEAYTVAILFHEEFERRNVQPNLIIFASDIDEAALAVAREGVYPRAIGADVSEARLDRYLQVDDHQYRIATKLRDHVVFAAHSLLRDPPFSRMDLISCRNLLIYLDRDLQDQVMSVFRYACRDDGYLILGASESAPEDLFHPVDKKYRIFAARARASGERPVLPDILTTPADRLARTSRDAPSAVRSPLETHLAALEATAPPTAVVDERWNVVHLSSSASRFFLQSGGPLARRITELVRPELRDELHGLLQRAIEQRAPQLSSFGAVTFNGAAHRVALLVQPRPRPDDRIADILVTFLDAGEVTSEPVRLEKDETEQVRHVREQLRQAERRIETMRDEHYLTNEDLRAANEELQSLNEEYRSTTEELETSKEELQSINEELQTVNQELKLKLEEVSRAHGDLENLVAAADVGILFLDPDLRIKRFTPQLGQIFNVKTRDLDRPISDLTHVLQYETLESDARRVLATREAIERTTSTSDGRTFVVRLRPYTTGGQHTSDGVVATFIDTTAITHAEASLSDSERRLAEELEIMRRLYQLTLSAATAPNVSSALLHVITAAVELQAAQFGTVELSDRETKSLEIVASLGLPADVLTTIQEIDVREESACGRARQRRDTIHVPDILKDKDYDSWGAEVGRAGYRAVQCTPLISRNHEFLGCLSVYFVAPHTFSGRDKQLSTMVGQQAADLIESRQQHETLARLNEALRARTRELEDSQERLSRQAEELIAEDRNREEFLAGLGHELRNPLAAITGSLALISASDDRSRRAIAVLHRQTKHMTRLVGDLLDISRVKHGKLHLERAPIDVNQWIQAAIEAARPAAEAKGLDLRFDMPSDQITVDADPERLTQVLDNLLRNATTYTDRGAITVSVRREVSHARIGVRDTGAGLDAADMPALFKPYQQHPGKGPPGGLGLGLALVKALVEAHGGTVSVRSEGRGVGSEFGFTIPVSAEAVASTRSAAPVSLPRYRVVVVDDDRDVGDAFAGLLESLDQEVMVVYSANDALQLVLNEPPRVAFIDLAMPEIDGWDLARRLRGQFRRQDLMIIAVTGHGTPSTTEPFRDFDHHLMKPVSRETVVELLRAVADQDKKS
jgi:two-component system CheB/CheR fusion protein